MSEYRIITDVGADLGADKVAELGIVVLPMSITLDGKTYRHYHDCREISIKDFYDAVRSGVMPSTSAVNMDEFKEAAIPLLEDGIDVLFLPFSSGLSATAHAAAMAAEELSALYPDRKVYTADTLAASLGHGMVVCLAVQLQAQGKSIEEVRDWVLAHRLEIHHTVAAEDLHHLHRGGRVSAASALLGSMLSIKPILIMDDTGHLHAVDKIRGRAASLKALVDRMEREVIDPENQTVFISHSDCLADAEAVAEMIRTRLGTKNFYINYIGPLIGSHTGTGTVALFYRGKGRQPDA